MRLVFTLVRTRVQKICNINKKKRYCIYFQGFINIRELNSINRPYIKQTASGNSLVFLKRL